MLFYSTEIFAAAGIQYSEVATVIVGVTLFGFTVVTVRLAILAHAPLFTNPLAWIIS